MIIVNAKTGKISARHTANYYIAVPEKLVSDEGKVYEVVRWSPTFSKEEIITIECKLIPQFNSQPQDAS